MSDNLLDIVSAPEHGASIIMRQKGVDDPYEIQLRFDGCVNISEEDDNFHVCDLPGFIALLEEARMEGERRWGQYYCEKKGAAQGDPNRNESGE